MTVILITALIALLYILATRKSRSAEPNPYKSGVWVTPGNGYGRHGYHAHKSR